MSEISTELVSRLVTRRTSDGRCVYDGRNVAALRADERFGPHFRLRVGPGRAQRPIFVDELARLGWPMHEHGAGEDELLDLESLAQPAQQARRALERELLVLRARFAEEIVVGGRVDHRGDPRPMFLAKNAQSFPHTFVGSDVDGHAHAVLRRWSGCFAVEAYDIVETLAQALAHCAANASV